MSFIPAANLQEALRLPTQQATDQGMAAIGGLLSSQGQKTAPDYSKPTDTTKQVEALYKLKTESSLDQFKSLTRKVNLVDKNGMCMAVDAATGEDIASIAPIVTPNQPANIAVGPDVDNTADFKVMIYQEPMYADGSAGSDLANMVIFTVMPSISESRSASYESFTPLHHPGEILKFKSTQARSWNVSARLISRTTEEASNNLRILNTIRSWVMPFYGQGTAADAQTQQYLGAPPPILTLKAYGEKMVGPVKTVLETYSWDFPNDVDYIPTNSGEPFPVIISVTLNLKESWSPAEYSGFDISAYRQGQLPKAFTSVKYGAWAKKSEPITTAVDVNTSEPENISQDDANAAQPEYEAPMEINYDLGRPMNEE